MISIKQKIVGVLDYCNLDDDRTFRYTNQESKKY